MSPWPLPRHYDHGSSTLWLSRDVQCVYQTYNDPQRKTFDEFNFQQSSSSTPDRAPVNDDIRADLRLKVAWERFLKCTFGESFVPYEFYPKGYDFEPDLRNPRQYITGVMISKIELPEEKKAQLSNEAYAIQMWENGNVLIEALSSLGVMRALDTLAQMFYTHSESPGEVYTQLAPAFIKDAPMFSHRGLNLDISRNRISPEDVVKTITAMSYVKLNRLHLHASDAQSWPLEIPSLPELAQKGAYHKSQIWSTADLKRVQDHGALLGIEVYLEIDMPGHTASIHHAYPHIITAYNQQPWDPYAQEPPSGQLKLNHPDMPSFIETLLGDLLPRCAEASPLFHVGCDELNLRAYELDETVQSSSPEDIRPLLQKFFNHVFKIAETHGQTIVAWEEILLQWELDLPRSAIIQSWLSKDSVAKIVGRGHRAIFGPCSHWYLDCGYGAWIDPNTQKPEPGIQDPFLDWCSPYKNWRRILAYDPLEGIPADQQHLVIGGEVHLWGELTDGTTLEVMLWPRAAAAAELLWRGHGEITEGVTRRLSEIRERLLKRGIQAHRVQMEWCLQNPGNSAL